MKIDFTLDKHYLPEKIHIVSEQGENRDWLHTVSRNLIITNPVFEFTEHARSGDFNDLSDLDYEKVLSVMKRLSLLFMMGDGKTTLPGLNIFYLLEALLYEYMLNNHTESSRII